MANVYHPIFPDVSAVLQAPGVSSATQHYPLGTKLEARDGRLWRYARAGGVALSPGLMGQMTPPHANVNNIAQAGMSSNIGDTEINVLLTTGHGYVAGDFADGWLVIEDATGEGHSYRIRTNTVVTIDTVHRLFLHEPIIVATDADSEITIVPNQYGKVIVQPTTVTGIAVGVPNGTITAEHYYWAQRRGPVGMVVDAGDTVVVGALVGTPATHGTPGGVGIPAATSDIWGRCMNVAAAGETALIELFLE